jgi:hypothetical protein
MHAKHPKIAARWDKEYPDQDDLPEHVDRKKRVRRAALKKLSAVK